MPIVDEVRNAEVVPIAIPARIEEPLSEMDIAQVEEEIAPKVEQNEKVMEENTEMEAVNKPLIAIESETLTPSTSDAFLSRADDKVFGWSKFLTLIRLVKSPLLSTPSRDWLKNKRPSIKGSLLERSLF